MSGRELAPKKTTRSEKLPSSPPGLVALLRQALSLVELRRRRRLWLLGVAAFVNSILEAVGALWILLVVQMVSDPSRREEAVGGSILARLPNGMSDDDLVVTLALGLGAFYLLKNAWVMGQTALQVRECALVAESVAVRLLRSYMEAPYALHLQRSSAELVRTITTGADGNLLAFFMSAVALVSEALLVLALAVVLLLAEPVITPIALTTVGLLLFTSYRVVRQVFDRVGRDTYRLAAWSLGDIQQALGALREARVLDRQGHFIGQYIANRSSLTKVTWRYYAATAMPRLVFESIFVLGLAGTITRLTFGGDSRLGTAPLLGLFAYAGLRFLPSGMRIMTSLSTMRHTAPAVRDLCAELEVSNTKARNATAREVPRPVRATGFSRFEVDGVTYRYPGREQPAVTNVSFSVARGESVGIVGPTGSGKSTLLNLLIGLLEPTSGRIAVHGGSGGPVQGSLSGVGYVPQEPFLLDDTLRHNIAFGVPDIDIDEDRLREAVSLAHLDDLVGSLPEGLAVVVGERGVRLSGGQRQRIAIARALYPGPEILMFDEATSSLDYGTEREINAAIEELAGVKTLVIVAHRLSAVRACDRIVFLVDGRVADIGSFDDLLGRDPAFAELVRVGSVGAEAQTRDMALNECAYTRSDPSPTREA